MLARHSIQVIDITSALQHTSNMFMNILEAICAFPSVLLERFVEAGRLIVQDEKQLIREGEYEEEENE